MLFRAISRGVTLRLVARHLCTLTPSSMCHCIPPAHSHMVYTNKHLMPAYTHQLAHSKTTFFTLYEENSGGVCPYSHNARCYQGVFIVMQLLWCYGLLVGCCYVIVNVFWVVAMLLLGWYESLHVGCCRSVAIRGGKSTKIFYSSKSTITLLKFYLSTSKSTSLKIYSSKSKK